MDKKAASVILNSILSYVEGHNPLPFFQITSIPNMAVLLYNLPSIANLDYLAH